MGFWVVTFLKSDENAERNSSTKLYKQHIKWWRHLANYSELLFSEALMKTTLKNDKKLI